MRMFAAVLPPPEAVTEVGAAVRRLRALPGAERLRWTEPDGWHLTLAFYGECGAQTLRELAERLARAARRSEPLGVRLAGGGHFGDRALWAGVAEGSEGLRRLSARAVAAGRRAGVGEPAGGRGGSGSRRGARAHRFRPHLTLARAGSSGSPELQEFAAALSELRGTLWQGERLALVRSHLPVSGVPGEQPRYTTEGEWPLGSG